LEEFTKDVIQFIKKIPKGTVVSYGHIAKSCGKPTGARQVLRILHSQSKKHKLPWHRVINSQGKISLTGESYEIQRAMLEHEGLSFSQDGKIAPRSSFHS
jgi:methylated-DNA-protein-cysteine methyltransferase-like protein